jgi:hypothetical protein
VSASSWSRYATKAVSLHQLASRHPGVVTLHKVLEEGDFIFVIMDFYDEGDLFGMITAHQRVSVMAPHVQRQS